MLYFVEYDLRKERDYQSLWDELKRFGARRVLKSLWCFERVDTNVVGLRDHLRRFIDANDGLIVMEVGSNWAGIRMDANPHNAVTA